MMREASAKQTLLGPCCIANRRSEEAPFLAEISKLGGEISLHAFRIAGTPRLDVAQRPRHRKKRDTVIYCCGPERLMTAVEEANLSLAGRQAPIFELVLRPAARARPAG